MSSDASIENTSDEHQSDNGDEQLGLELWQKHYLISFTKSVNDEGDEDKNYQMHIGTMGQLTKILVDFPRLVGLWYLELDNKSGNGQVKCSQVECIQRCQSINSPYLIGFTMSFKGPTRPVWFGFEDPGPLKLLYTIVKFSDL